MTDTCHHNRNLMWGCSECELEGKLAELRGQLAEARLEHRRMMDHATVLSTRLAGALDERDALGEKAAELKLIASKVISLEAELTKRAEKVIAQENRITQLENECESDGVEINQMIDVIAELEDKALERAGRIAALEVELAAERMKVFELEKAANEKEWLEDRAVDLENQLESERDRRIEAERSRFGVHEEEG